MSNEKTLADTPLEEKKDAVMGTLMDAADMQSKTDDQMQELLKKVQEHNNNGEYEQMIKVLETCMRLEPSNGYLVLLVAMAYRDDGKKIQAVHWFRKAFSEFGVMEAKQELMRLYKTGIAGPDCKKQAEEYFAEEEARIAAEKKAEEERIDAEKKANLLKDFGPEKEEYSEEFIDKMDYLLALEQVYIDRLPKLKLEPVPEKKGFIFTNKKEIERIEIENANKAAEKKVIIETREATLKELEEGKKACGGKRKLFYEYPIVMEWSREFFSQLRGSNKGYSLYSFGNEDLQDYHLNNQGYGPTGSFIAGSFCSGDLDFLIYDMAQNRKLVNKEYPVGEREVLYLLGERNNRLITLSYLKKVIDHANIIPLYCNWEYLKEHSDEKFVMNYLWDMELRFVSKCNDSKSVVENLATFYMCEQNLTNEYWGIGEGRKYSNIREALVQEAKVISGNSYSKPEFDALDEFRYKKKALIVWHNKKVVGILIPKKEADVVVIRGEYETHPDKEKGEGYAFRVKEIEREPGVCWKYYIATTIDHISRKMLGEMPPMDLTEEKPEGFPEDLWRYWFRLRYYFAHQK